MGTGGHRRITRNFAIGDRSRATRGLEPDHARRTRAGSFDPQDCPALELLFGTPASADRTRVPSDASCRRAAATEPAAGEVV
jgi:hypothetical protein